MSISLLRTLCIECRSRITNRKSRKRSRNSFSLSLDPPDSPLWSSARFHEALNTEILSSSDTSFQTEAFNAAASRGPSVRSSWWLREGTRRFAIRESALCITRVIVPRQTKHRQWGITVGRAERFLWHRRAIRVHSDEIKAHAALFAFAGNKRVDAEDRGTLEISRVARRSKRRRSRFWGKRALKLGTPESLAPRFYDFSKVREIASVT